MIKKGLILLLTLMAFTEFPLYATQDEEDDIFLAHPLETSQKRQVTELEMEDSVRARMFQVKSKLDLNSNPSETVLQIPSFPDYDKVWRELEESVTGEKIGDYWE